ncbi:hypothetical protein H6P81_018218 [Aristolochia fimbriata]|uniref:Uncharacterized protein n=1 Tax=Aristolochia fimbriata TaxID=158543 RepID=A0AAV7E1K9_ARIFI|nr:hypothetical protein H6P81_018218 [Aristolochia fimbriata]
MAGIMDLMKNMYEEGDEDMKRTIAKAWTDARLVKRDPLKGYRVATLAEWEDEQSNQAAFLLDLASIEGTWTDFLEQIAECYKEVGLDEIAKFVLYRDP